MSQLLDKFWKYINEGNVHVVLQILDSDYVLRFIKEDGKPVNLETVRTSVNFVNLVMVPLISNKIYGTEEVLEIPASELQNINTNLLEIRPKHRSFKSVFSCYAIKAPNLAILSPNCDTNYCIEIKPKEGFMSPRFEKYGKCYYCLKQFLKLQQRQIETVSNYCPLDLFSGNAAKMKLALLNLVKNPQNNFKIFKNGNIIYSDNSCESDMYDIVKTINIFENSLNMFLDFLVGILLNDNKNIKLKKMKDIIIYTIKEKCTENNILEKKSFLYNILLLQKLSTYLNTDTLNLNIEHIEYVSIILEELKKENLDLKLDIDKDKFIKMTDPTHLAIISAIAKDCSIMISFSTNYDRQYPYVEIGDSKISYKIASTDLEPKPIKTLVKRRNMEQKLLDTYQKFLEPTKQ